MPIGKRRQSNAMLYTLITFVALFITATAIAVIYYVKFEEQIDLTLTAQSDLEKMINSGEQRKGLGRIVGTIPRNKSALSGGQNRNRQQKSQRDTGNVGSRRHCYYRH
jgi:hypothetical protein